MPSDENLVAIGYVSNFSKGIHKYVETFYISMCHLSTFKVLLEHEGVLRSVFEQPIE